MAVKTYHIDLNRPIVALDGKPVLDKDTPVLANKVLANVMSQSAQKEMPLKFWGWCQSLWKEGTIELDHEDFLRLKEYVGTLNLSLLILGQVMEALTEAQTAAEKG